MASPALPSFIPVDDYLTGERLSEVRHEYVDGCVFAMAGASRAHNSLSLRLASLLDNHLRGGPCSAFVGDMKVRLRISETDIFYYPDVVVTCDTRDTDDYFLRFPKLIVEVLSHSTERLDRFEKFQAYRTIPTLEEYVLVSQRLPEVTMHRRANQWAPEIFRATEDDVRFESVGLTLSVAQIYENVRQFPGEPPPPL